MGYDDDKHEEERVRCEEAVGTRYGGETDSAGDVE
jgi:hypothetical protein